MKVRFSKHALNRMSIRGIKKEEILRVIQFHQKRWIPKKDTRLEIFALDELTVVKNRHNGCIVTVYRYGDIEEWHE